MKKIFVLAALTLAACACSKETFETPFNPEDMEFTNTLTLNGRTFHIEDDAVELDILYYDTYTDELGFIEPVYVISGTVSPRKDRTGTYDVIGFALFVPIDNENKMINLKDGTGGILYATTKCEYYSGDGIAYGHYNEPSFSSGYFKSKANTISGINFNDFDIYDDEVFSSYTAIGAPKVAKYYFSEYPRVEMCKFYISYQDAEGNSLEISFRGYYDD